MKKHTWSLCARALGISTTTLAKYRERPDSPDRPDLYDWQDFIEANDLGFAKNKLSTDGDRERQADAVRQIEEIDTANMRRMFEFAESIGLSAPAYVGLLRRPDAPPHLDAGAWREWIEGQDLDDLEETGKELCDAD